jgi:Mg-chelatase subunit ChlD
MRGRVNRVVLLTDGDFNVGVTDPSKLKDFVADKRKTGIYLSVYGFGRGNYNDTMMQALAQNGNGTAAYVDTSRRRGSCSGTTSPARCSPSPTTSRSRSSSTRPRSANTG